MMTDMIVVNTDFSEVEKFFGGQGADAKVWQVKRSEVLHRDEMIEDLVTVRDGNAQ